MAGRINIGDFNSFVYVQASTTSKSSRGETINTWTNVYTFWADVDFSVSENEGIQGTNDTQRVTVTTHYLPDLTTRHRLVIDGTNYDIKTINREGSVYMIIEANETE